jgi:hypothetical protein
MYAKRFKSYYYPLSATGAYACQHTVHYPKLEKSERKPRKSSLQKKPSQTQRPEADATMKNA